jgi:hypothetical protein
MSDTRLTLHQRVAAVDNLDRLAREANRAASWLSDQGFETEADMIEDAARDIMAAVGLLSRPIRPQLPPESWR